MSMGQLYLLNHKRHWACLFLPRCASTTLKILALTDDYPEHLALADPDAVHVAMGFESAPDRPWFATPESVPAEYRRFAVWRDPVDRMVSLWRFFCAHGSVYKHPPFEESGLAGCSLLQFAEYVSEKLNEPPFSVDDHLRRQIDHYDARLIDDLVFISDLDEYLGMFGHRDVPMYHKTSPLTKEDCMAREMFRTLYPGLTDALRSKLYATRHSSDAPIVELRDQ